MCHRRERFLPLGCIGAAPEPTNPFYAELSVEVETVKDFGTVGAVLGRQVPDNEFPAGGQ